MVVSLVSYWKMADIHVLTKLSGTCLAFYLK